jgi:hypothetical protein
MLKKRLAGMSIVDAVVLRAAGGRFPVHRRRDCSGGGGERAMTTRVNRGWLSPHCFEMPVSRQLGANQPTR